MALAQRFAFTQILKPGQQRLVQAELLTPIPFLPRAARIVRELEQVPGSYPSDGSVPQTYQLILPSPSNRYIVVFAAEIGTDFIDFNIVVYDQMTGTSVRCNEHSFSATNRANCPSPLFNAFVASETAFGVPADVIAGYDYSVVVEGTGVGTPTLAWTAEETLLVRYGFDVLVIGAGSLNLGRDQFEYEVAPTAPLTVLSRNAGRPHAPARSNPFRVVPGSRGRMVIGYGKRWPPLPFTGWLRYIPLMRLIPGVLRYQSATHVAGYAK